MNTLDDKEKIEKLRKLYLIKGRHSQYQLLASNLQKIVKDGIPSKYKYEMERLDYIKKYVDFQNKTVLDIGGNTGYFTFEACNLGVAHVDYYEGNQTHAEFVNLAAELLKFDDIVNVHSEYYLFEKNKKQYDIAILLNVLHHLGFDFRGGVTMGQAKKEILNSINILAFHCKYIAFQIGFNWCGNINNCLFKHGTKKEVENFVREGTKDHWMIKKIGIPVQKNDKVAYEDVSLENNERNDAMGEFLNRPLFIMKSMLCD